MERPEREQSGKSSGYVLLEVIISTAIAASILYLLTTSLSALGRAQDRAAVVAENLSSAIFDDVLLRSMLEGVRPDYADGSNTFTGNDSGLVGWTWLADGELSSPVEFKISAIEDKAGFRVDLQIGDETRTVLAKSTGRATIEYVGFDNKTAPQWTAKEQPDPQSAVIRFAQYCHTVPRQVRLIVDDGEGNTVVRSYSLSSNNWPVPRSGDTGVLGPF